jgi:hypothetical protein
MEWWSPTILEFGMQILDLRAENSVTGNVFSFNLQSEI